MAKKILVIKSDNFGPGGMSNYLLSHLEIISTHKDAEITLYTPGCVTSDNYRRLAESANIRVIEGGINWKSKVERMLRFPFQLFDLLKAEHFDVIHINSAIFWMEVISLYLAKFAGIPCRIAHAHSTSPTRSGAKKVLDRFARFLINRKVTELLACSDTAGIYLFGEQEWKARGKVAANGIDTSKFEFSRSQREATRNLYCIQPQQHSVVYAFIGRLEQEKNPAFFIDIAHHLQLLDTNYEFWIIGDGSLRAQLESQSNLYGLSDTLRFFGEREDIADLMQGVDCLIFPSVREGLGLSLIEAQAAGVPCFASQSVPRSAHVQGCRISFYSLEDSADSWAKNIHASDLTRIDNARELVTAAGYDLNSSAEELACCYGL